jgi:transglutaminase-like putative cysteine protease
MVIRVEHSTRFRYDAPISEAYTEMRLRPLSTGGQRCLSFSLSTRPEGRTVMAYRDRFGNDVRHFDVLEPHSELVVEAASEVMTSPQLEDREGELSPLDRIEYLAPSAYAPEDASVESFAAERGQGGGEELAWSLMRGVHEAVAYETGTTDVTTTAPEALALGRGVCQDLAHVLLGVCRSQGLPARYVSGYLLGESGQEQASHAWVDVFLAGGWRSLDPTHVREQDERYVRVAVGRDYADVAPTRGVWKGSANETLEVRVELRAL